MNTEEVENTGYDLCVTLNDFQMSYDDVGAGSSTVLFLHGFPFDKSMWHQQLEYFHASHRLIACDIRGFGKSKYEDKPISIAQFADDLIEFMDKLEVESTTICGLSMGGFIALNAMKRFPTHFDALILCDTQCIADSPEKKAQRLDVIEKIKSNGSEQFRKDFVKSVFHENSLTNKTELVEQLGAVVDANSDEILMQGLLALAEREETCSSLKEIAVPTLILCGREDTITPLLQSEFMHKSIFESTLHVIEAAGHVSNLEQADDFNHQLLNFLIKLDHQNFEKINGKERMN